MCTKVAVFLHGSCEVSGQNGCLSFCQNLFTSIDLDGICLGCGAVGDVSGQGYVRYTLCRDGACPVSTQPFNGLSLRIPVSVNRFDCIHHVVPWIDIHSHF
jgi:hypothetical protein